MPFPGVTALAPTLGAALIILFSSQTTVVGKILSTKPLVAVGLLSYSIYLWHQPLFAFARLRSSHEPSLWVFLSLSLVSLFLAYFTWKYIESPFRNRKKFNRKGIFTSALTVSVLFIFIGVIGNKTQGMLFVRDAEAKSALEIKLLPNKGLDAACNSLQSLNPKCATSDAPEVLLWGDSFAMHLAYALIESKPDIKLAQRTYSDCAPVLGYAHIRSNYPEKEARKCLSFNDSVFSYIKNTPTLKYVVLSSSWTSSVGDGTRVINKSGEVQAGDDVTLPAFKETLDKIIALGLNPVIVSPPPQNGKNIGTCLLNSTVFKQDLSVCDISYQEVLIKKQPIHEFLRALAPDYSLIWLHDYLCNDGMCLSHAGSTFLYRDSGHLSVEGSQWLGKHIDFLE